MIKLTKKRLVYLVHIFENILTYDTIVNDVKAKDHNLF